jgi:hypothetical protein
MRVYITIALQRLFCTCLDHIYGTEDTYYALHFITFRPECTENVTCIRKVELLNQLHKEARHITCSDLSCTVSIRHGWKMIPYKAVC